MRLVSGLPSLGETLAEKRISDTNHLAKKTALVRKSRQLLYLNAVNGGHALTVLRLKFLSPYKGSPDHTTKWRLDKTRRPRSHERGLALPNGLTYDQRSVSRNRNAHRIADEQNGTGPHQGGVGCLQCTNRKAGHTRNTRPAIARLNGVKIGAGRRMGRWWPWWWWSWRWHGPTAWNPQAFAGVDDVSRAHLGRVGGLQCLYRGPRPARNDGPAIARLNGVPVATRGRWGRWRR